MHGEQLLDVRVLAQLAQELQPLDRQVRPLRPFPPPSSLPHGPDPRYTDRYLYVPIGGATHAAWATLVVFTFVALWHDLSLKLLTWGWVISLFVLPEMAARKFVSYEEVRPGPPPSFPLFPSPAPLKYEEGKHARLTSASFYFVFWRGSTVPSHGTATSQRSAASSTSS